MKLQSWIGKNVRIRKEFLKKYKDDYGRTEWQTTISDSPINQFLNNPKTDVFYVLQDVWGTDLFYYRHKEADVKKLKHSHQLILRGGQFSSYPYLWDAKYFEIVSD